MLMKSWFWLRTRLLRQQMKSCMLLIPRRLCGWFEREGYDLEYDVEEEGFGQFLCRVEYVQFVCFRLTECVVNVCLSSSFISRTTYWISLNFGIMGWSPWGIGRLLSVCQQWPILYTSLRIVLVHTSQTVTLRYLKADELSHFSQIWLMRQNYKLQDLISLRSASRFVINWVQQNHCKYQNHEHWNPFSMWNASFTLRYHEIQLR